MCYGCDSANMAMLAKDNGSGTCNGMNMDPCRSVLVYFHADKVSLLLRSSDAMVTQISVSRLAVIELPVIVMVFHMDDPFALSCTIRIPRKISLSIFQVKRHCGALFSDACFHSLYAV